MNFIGNKFIMPEKLVSIITPNYNCENYIAQTIDSVIAQTYTNWEMIIVDDCSSDKSTDIVKSYIERDKRIKLFTNQRQMGAAYSRNVALDNSYGDYIAFLDSDDLWESDKLEKQINFMEMHNCDFSFSKYDLINQNGETLGKTAKVINRLTYYRYLHHCFTGCLTVVYKKNINPNIRSFLIKNNNDYGLFLQIVRQANNARGINEVLAHYRLHSTGISRNKKKKIKPYFELMHKHLHYPYFICCWLLFTNVLIGKLWKYEKK